jgi:hypothetical protein
MFPITQRKNELQAKSKKAGSVKQKARSKNKEKSTPLLRKSGRGVPCALCGENKKAPDAKRQPGLWSNKG